MPRNQQQKQLLEKWYLPHHGIYHPNKPGKMKVVFYLGEDFNGRSGTGLKVSKNVHGEEVRWLNLPATYTREDLPANFEQVTTQEKATKWDHLKIIADKLATETKMDIGLLIGVNPLKALEPEVLPCKDGGPFTFRTPLGWSVVGALTKLGRESSISCNQIVALDIATRK